MKEYQMSLSSVLQLPKAHFFWMNNMIPRVRAEQNLALLKVLVAAQSTQEGLKDIEAELREDMGTIYYQSRAATKTITVEDENTLDPEFDREGLRALKMKHGA
jgi:hypothetical protein